MLFYVQMKWVLRDKSIDDLFRLEADEIRHAQSTAQSGMLLHIWKVASQHRVIAIVDVESAEELDGNSMFGLPMRNHLEFEVVWALTDYQQFGKDLLSHVGRLPAPA